MKINISRRGHVAVLNEWKGTCRAREGEQLTQEEGRQSAKALHRRGEEQPEGQRPPLPRRWTRGHQTSPRGDPGKQPIGPQSKPASREPALMPRGHQPGEGEKTGEVGQEVTRNQSRRKGSVRTEVPGLTRPPALAPRWGQGRTEEIPLRPGLVEDVDEEGEHAAPNLDGGDERGGGDKGIRTADQRGAASWHDLHPIDKTVAATLSGGDIRDEPVPRKEPAGMEEVNEIENRGVAGEREDHVEAT
jgi:hypothetical protein